MVLLAGPEARSIGKAFAEGWSDPILQKAGCSHCGRLVAVGFSGGEIPAVKVNRLLLNNTEVVGAAWGEYALGDPDGAREIGREVNRLVDDGFVRPLIGQRFPLDQAAEALKVIDRRQALGKIVLDVR